jgi:hypothetical protein
MDDKTVNAGVSTERPANGRSSQQAAAVQSTGQSTAQAVTEQRQAFGTAKTENLRDSGWWRIVLPVLVVIFCIALLAIPLAFLIPLLVQSLNPAASTGASGAQLTWVWIVMIVLEVAIAAIIIRGLIKIFMTQAGNYSR